MFGDQFEVEKLSENPDTARSAQALTPFDLLKVNAGLSLSVSCACSHVSCTRHLTLWTHAYEEGIVRNIPAMDVLTDYAKGRGWAVIYDEAQGDLEFWCHEHTLDRREWQSVWHGVPIS